MLDTPSELLQTQVEHWLAGFESVASDGNWEAVEALFLPDSHWRDLLALTWNIETVGGAVQIATALESHVPSAGVSGFRVDPARTPPRTVTRAGREAIEAIIAFETAVGRGEGVLRLAPDAEDGGALKAWTLLTAMVELNGFEESLDGSRPSGEAYSRDFRGPNWRDLRKASAAYADRDPVALVVGGGQAGLSIAARLTQLGIDTLIVDRNERIGDNWRNRYHALTLHNQVHVNHLPYMPFPPNWPRYIPKDKLAGWFEAYAESMELNFWTGTEFLGGTYDDRAGEWSVMLRLADGEERGMRPRHVVMATGVSGVPSLPDIPSLTDFEGKSPSFQRL